MVFIVYWCYSSLGVNRYNITLHINITPLLHYIYNEQRCGTGTGTMGTVTFRLAEPEPELEP
jgi:hypothetical protein